LQQLALVTAIYGDTHLQIVRGVTGMVHTELREPEAMSICGGRNNDTRKYARGVGPGKVGYRDMLVQNGIKSHTHKTMATTNDAVSTEVLISICTG
jgi:hypothetical protein